MQFQGGSDESTSGPGRSFAIQPNEFEAELPCALFEIRQQEGPGARGSMDQTYPGTVRMVRQQATIRTNVFGSRCRAPVRGLDAAAVWTPK